jgi:hypothetical protein
MPTVEGLHRRELCGSARPFVPIDALTLQRITPECGSPIDIASGAPRAMGIAVLQPISGTGGT